MGRRVKGVGSLYQRGPSSISRADSRVDRLIGTMILCVSVYV
jgi:hypothetical protein